MTLNSRILKRSSSYISLERKWSPLSNGTKVLKISGAISWLLFELKYILCPKVKNFENFQKALKCCSFINNGDTELKLGVC